MCYIAILLCVVLLFYYVLYCYFTVCYIAILLCVILLFYYVLYCYFTMCYIAISADTHFKMLPFISGCQIQTGGTSQEVWDGEHGGDNSTV